jgi:iron complex outermembrane recepter protein
VSSLFLTDSMGNLVPNQVKTSNNSDPITGKEGFGIPKLKQETSTNASGGVTLRPFENLSVTADAYFIRLKNRIVLTNQFTNSVNNMRYAPVADILDQFPGVTAAQFFANAVDTDTTGADVVGDYAVDTGGSGTILLSAAANFTKTEVKAIHVPSSLTSKFPASESAQLSTFFFDRLAKNRLEDSVPHQKGNVAIRYNYKQLSALARANYYGRVVYKPDIVTDTETFGAKVLFDADLGYQFTKNMQLVVGGDNLLNTFPDKNTKPNNISLGRFIYNRNVTQFGLNGGFYYAKLELTFF